ncbi:MAG TPA: hypothetical protein DD723_04605 [Candidatus Omnitrophica bacterium]|nr:MAG: hypothetical protein A2Z81_04105 [Omnitrophica WOR_2 bacterium GWA2_45_18]HBR14810.1 hypothetical protein [Candidatus Omnitrophota bacterium]
MRLIDTHAHLDHVQNLEAALERAAQAGVEGIVAVSTNLAASRRNLEIKKTYPNPRLYLAMGIHPSDADGQELEECVDLIRAHVDDLAAIGEIGLDFWYKDVKKEEGRKDEQRRVFETLLDLAQELNLPVVVHSRGAWQECYAMVKERRLKKAVFHWYSGPLDVLDKILAKGYYISATPSLAYSSQLREAVSHAPVEQTLIETDCPVYYRSLEPSQDQKGEASEGFQAEPKDVFKTLQAYCALKKMEEEAAAEILNRNARELFGIEG